MGEFIYIVEMRSMSFGISKSAEIAYDDQELARSVLRKQMEVFKQRYTSYIDDEGWDDFEITPDLVDISAYSDSYSFHFFGTIRELFVHGEGANLIGFSGSVVRSNDRPDVMCSLRETQVSYNDTVMSSNAAEVIDVETQTEVNDLDLGDDGSPNGFSPATPEDELRFSVAREAIRERNRNK